MPVLRKALLDGAAMAADALGSLAADGNAAARDALVDALDADLMTSHLAEAIASHEPTSRLRLALVSWCGRQKSPSYEQIEPVARLLSRLRPAGAREALARFLDVKLAPDASAAVGTALVDLGEPRAFPALVSLVRGGASAGRKRELVAALDAISGLRHPALCRPGAKPDDAAWDAAAGEFDAWWSSAKDVIRFEPASEIWVLPGGGAPAGQHIRRALARAADADDVGEDHPSVAELAGLGRPAVPALVDELCAARSSNEQTALRFALSAIVLPADVPLLRERLLAGFTGAAGPLGELASRGSDDAVKALLDAVAKDVFDFAVADALHRSVEPDVRGKSVAAWLRRNKGADENAIAWAFSSIGTHGGEGFPALVRDVLVAARDSTTVYWAAQALARCGEKSGIELMIDVVADRKTAAPALRSGFRTFDRVAAARWLDWLSELDHWRVSEWDGGPPPSEVHFRAAAMNFDRWWRRVGPEIRFDAATGIWITESGARAPEIAARIAEIAKSLPSDARPPVDHPAVKQAHALGASAAEGMLEALRLPSADAKTRALVAAALPRVAGEAHIPAMREHLLAGRTEVAPALGKLATAQYPLAAGALLDGISAGIMDRDFDRVTAGVPRDQLAHAVLSWCAKRPERGRGSIAAAASILSFLAPRGAADAIFPLAAKAEHPDDIHQVGRALVSFGDKRGFPLLLRVAANGDRDVFANGAVRDYTHAQRYDALERIAAASDLTWDGVFEPEGAGPVPASQEPAFAAAAAAAAKWWESVGERLVWDEKLVTWRVAKRN